MPGKFLLLYGENTLNKYVVKLYTRAYRDLDDIYTYIAETLLEPGTALDMVDELEEAIFSLEQLPERAQFVTSVLIKTEITVSYLSKIIALFTV